jgi:hypothetical protein
LAHRLGSTFPLACSAYAEPSATAAAFGCTATSSSNDGSNSSAPLPCLMDCAVGCESDVSCLDDCNTTELCPFLEEFCAGYSYTVCTTTTTTPAAASGSCYSSTSTATRLAANGRDVETVSARCAKMLCSSREVPFPV